ncbi:type 2A phosphatase activator TIP41 [Vararia minispora EC-137]|uniref:Type 2A phosphatase activator TIP41 n=1 Tax=Vararia minispora EC-137 TaxID=1314806 RepID=A0ACB8QB42_9AGAM|nr:type 2A phosphatase activator TIP41 [Vararia minispora EC-137]
MSPAIALPEYKLTDTPTARSITIGAWRVTATTAPIADATQRDALQADTGLPPPEMYFASNRLEIVHAPTGWTYAFTARDALHGVRVGPSQPGDGAVKVGYADAWLRSRCAPDALGSTEPARPYDWTYTTAYGGHVADAGACIGTAWADAHGQHAIPVAELTRPDPILFYAEVPLFEDELHDNGASHLLVRIRVMPTCIFVLCRAALRVDSVLFRVHDTRLYASLSAAPPMLIRETSGWEAPYDRVGRRLPRPDDKTPLTDPNFIAKVLTELPKELTQSEGAGTGWRELGTRVEVATLVDVGALKIE